MNSERKVENQRSEWKLNIKWKVESEWKLYIKWMLNSEWVLKIQKKLESGSKLE